MNRESSTAAGDRVHVAGLSVAEVLYRFVMDEALPGSGVGPETFWTGLASLIDEFGGANRELLSRRHELQARIDEWHRQRQGRPHDAQDYRALLEEIGYLVAPGPAFEITTANVDPEIAEIAGPQLVVPVMNARYALNAANARWGSLYDALYGTDAIGTPAPSGPYDPERGNAVIAWVREFLDDVVPLRNGSHRDVVSYTVAEGALAATLQSGVVTGLAEPDGFAGFTGAPASPGSILLRHHQLHLELVIDPSHQVGRQDLAGVADVIAESAVTSIMDCEDSVSAVDAEDKVVVYRNWLGLMRGDLTEVLTKGDRTITRTLAPDREFTGADGSQLRLAGRSLMLVRNVGHLMTSDAVIDQQGHEIGEGLLDALMTALAARHDLTKPIPLNSTTGSMYVVKPKMHGPDEVAFADAIFGRVEDILGLARNTIKIGLMDEERRTSVNLAECIRAASSRLAFVNTGFLDRTGDEIHTSMEAGPMVRKADMRSQTWLSAYEDNNVDVGLACGLPGRAQIGKGMWAAPDLMAKMLEDKIGHPRAGANCAWVPSPTAATLHATHYHRVNVRDRQRELRARVPVDVDRLLVIPVADGATWTAEQRTAELDNNAQGILGYVVRWVDQGVGCSKVPDIDDVSLMEDRATCRISSQHIANWLRHAVVERSDVMATMRRMAEVVDRQNIGDPAYHPMAPDFDGQAFAAACDLVFSGVEQPAGYTEPVLHARRRAYKRGADR
jgi:malate synthase